MENTTPRIRSLLRQADRVADNGKRSAARKLYRQILDEAPETTAAWVGLANVTNDQVEKEEKYRHALELDPDNQEAQVGLDVLLHGEIVDEPLLDDFTEAKPTAAESFDFDSASEPGTIEKQPLPALDQTNDLEIEPTLTSPILAVHEDHDVEVTEGQDLLYCANHPGRKTHLRCNKCGKPICSSCAKPTPVGYRCPECIREHEDIFFSATALDYVVAILVALPLSLLGGWLATFLGFFTIFLGAFAGSLIGRVVFRATGRRRGRWMPQLVGAIVVIGGILPALPALLALFFGGFNLQILWSAIYVVTASGAAYYQMK